jgi:bifunctional non-homologous end joining protein LigD
MIDILEVLDLLLESVELPTTRFILHRHQTERKRPDHFDLRIKRLDSLTKAISFALPKATIPKEGEKLLLVKTPDHNVAWIFVNNIEIPSGNYGAGKISTEDQGKFKILKWDTNDNITFIANSKLMNGVYHIVNTNNNNYIFFKSNKS